jgi:hypothetical protein
MSNPTVLRTFLALVASTSLAAFACATVSFKAVEATGQVAVSLAGQEDALLTAALACREAHVMRLSDEAACETAEKQGPDMEKAVLAMSAYGAKLIVLAGGSEPEVNQQVAAALSTANVAGWVSISDGGARAVGIFVAAVASFVTEGYRNAKLVDIVRDTDEPLAQATLSLEHYIDDQTLNLTQIQRNGARMEEFLRTALACDAGSPSCTDASHSTCARLRCGDQGALNLVLAEASEPALLAMLADARLRVQRLAKLRGAVHALAVAHHALARGEQPLTSKELLQTVIKLIEASAGQPGDGGM